MERDGRATKAAGDASRRDDASSDGAVIVLPAGSAAVRPKKQQSTQQRVAAGHLRPQQGEKEEEKETKEQPAAGGEGAVKPGAELFVTGPPEKVFYKTRLCEKFSANGRCAYEDGCTFAHGHAELRPPLPLPPTVRRRMAPLPPYADGSGRTAGIPSHFFVGNGGKVCFEFRDRGTCSYGEKCNYLHTSAAVQPADMRYYAKLPEPARRSATPLGSVGVTCAPVAARAHGSDDEAAGQGGGKPKPSRLELLSSKKLSGIYGDWPEEVPDF